MQNNRPVLRSCPIMDPVICWSDAAEKKCAGWHWSVNTDSRHCSALNNRCTPPSRLSTIVPDSRSSFQQFPWHMAALYSLAQCVMNMQVKSSQAGWCNQLPLQWGTPYLHNKPFGMLYPEWSNYGCSQYLWLERNQISGKHYDCSWLL